MVDSEHIMELSADAGVPRIILDGVNEKKKKIKNEWKEGMEGADWENKCCIQIFVWV